MGMEYVYAALLLHKAGKGVDEDSLKKVVEAAGISADEIRIKALVAALSQVNIDEVLKSAAVMPVAAPAAAPAAAAAAPAAEEKKPAKEEEAKKEEEETALEGLSSLFG